MCSFVRSFVRIVSFVRAFVFLCVCLFLLLVSFVRPTFNERHVANLEIRTQSTFQLRTPLCAPKTPKMEKREIISHRLCSTLPSRTGWLDDKARQANTLLYWQLITHTVSTSTQAGPYTVRHTHSVCIKTRCYVLVSSYKGERASPPHL